MANLKTLPSRGPLPRVLKTEVGEGQPIARPFPLSCSDQGSELDELPQVPARGGRGGPCDPCVVPG